MKNSSVKNKRDKMRALHLHINFFSKHQLKATQFTLLHVKIHYKCWPHKIYLVSTYSKTNQKSIIILFIEEKETKTSKSRIFLFVCCENVIF